MHELMMIDDHELMIDCVCSVLSWALAGSAGWKIKQRKLGNRKIRVSLVGGGWERQSGQEGHFQVICMLEHGDEPPETLGTGRWLRCQDRDR